MDTTYGNVNFSGTAKHLLQRLWGGDLTLDAFLLECAYWAIKDGFDEIRVRALPSKPQTEAFKDYYMLPPSRRLKVDPLTFLRNPEINNYFNQVRIVRNMNKNCYAWLKDIKSRIPDDDLVCMDKVNRRLQDFQDWINQENEMIDKARQVFGGEVEVLE